MDMPSLQAGDTRVVFPTSDFVRALLDGRAKIHDPVPLLRLLRTKPRIFVSRDLKGQWSWLKDGPSAHLVSCDQPGWLLGLGEQRDDVVRFLSDEDLGDRSFSFGAAAEVYDAEALVVGRDAERFSLESNGRRDIALCHFDIVQEWGVHRSSLNIRIPGYPHEFEVMFRQAERAYVRLIKAKNKVPVERLIALRDMTDALLISVAARALRGDFS